MNIQDIFKRKDILIIVAVLLLAIIFGRNIYIAQRTELSTINAQIEEEEKRKNLLQVVADLEEKIKEYQDVLKGKDMSLLINRTAEFAGKAGVRITSLTPQQAVVKAKGLYLKLLLVLNLEGRYHCIGKFVSYIEAAPEIIKVENIKIVRQKTADEKGEDNLKGEMLISTVSLKE